MSQASLLVARSSNSDINLTLRMANRHGLITGATGTGKTVTLQRMAEQFSLAGVPVFMADVKGDLSGMAATGELSDKLKTRLSQLGLLDSFTPAANPVTFWDVFAQKGHPVRATISDMGPLLLSRLLNLNDTQGGVLQLIFKLADDEGLLLLDLKDLRKLVQFVGEHASQLTTEYGNISAASIGAIQRNLLSLETQGGNLFFGEPMLNIADFIQTDEKGRGVVNILASEKLYLAPQVYAAFLLWMMSELFENLPEVGDLDKPKLVFFFDEAHLLFEDAPQALIDKIEQVVRLIRSKGIGIFFVTQNPLDIPDKILGQLGNRVQHALRAFTPRDQKAVKTAADTLRANATFDTEKAIMELSVGEALISFLDDKGAPSIVERAFVAPPQSRLGPLSEDERRTIIQQSVLYGHYEQTQDRQSAFEVLTQQAQTTAAAEPTQQKRGSPPFSSVPIEEESNSTSQVNRVLFGYQGPRGGQHDGLVQTAAKSVVRSIGSSIGREIMRGVLGSLLGGRSR